MDSRIHQLLRVLGACVFAIAVVLAVSCNHVLGQIESTQFGVGPSSDTAKSQFREAMRQEIQSLNIRVAELQLQLDESARVEDLPAVTESEGISCSTPGDLMPHSAAENHDWIGSFPGSVRFPGSPVSAKVGGFIKVDLIHDFDAIASRDNFDTSTIFTDGRDGESTRFNARSTRLNLDTRWEACGKTVRTFVEGDFFSDNKHQNGPKKVCLAAVRKVAVDANVEPVAAIN